MTAGDGDVVVVVTDAVASTLLPGAVVVVGFISNA